MKLTNTCLTFALAVTCAAATLSADRIILKNGSELKADVLKSDEQSLVVDLGFTVLRLERAVVLEVLKSEEPNSLPPGKPKEKTPSPWQLYHSADLPPSTIEKNSERVGEAVVMVTSPAGLILRFLTVTRHPQAPNCPPLLQILSILSPFDKPNANLLQFQPMGEKGINQQVPLASKGNIHDPY